MKRLLIVTLALMVALFLAACGDDSADEQPVQPEGEIDPELIEVSEEEKVETDEIVVSINGKEIDGQAYNGLYAQTKSVLAYQGQDTDDQEQLKEVVIEELVNRELLTELAGEKGIEITGEDVSEFKSENEERYNDVLKQYGLSSEEYDKQLTFDLLRDKYISTSLPIDEVTDEEIEELYDEAKKENVDLPEIDEVEGELRELFVIQKFGEEIEELRSESTIEEKM